MTFDEFDEVTRQIIAQVCRMSETKGREYARSEDRFANFDRLAKDLQLSREKVLWVYLVKHLDAITNYVKDGHTHSSEPIEGRIVDAITYLMLLAGMIREGANEPKESS
jgi:hypothetical protein